MFVFTGTANRLNAFIDKITNTSVNTVSSQYLHGERSIPSRNILRFAKNCSSLTVQEIHGEIAEIKSVQQNNGVRTEAFVGEKMRIYSSFTFVSEEKLRSE